MYWPLLYTYGRKAGSAPVTFEDDCVGRIVYWMYDDFVQEPSAARLVTVVPNANLVQFLQRHRFNDELVDLFYITALSYKQHEICSMFSIP